MLPLTERLKRPSLFTRAYGARKLVSTPIFTLYVLPRQGKSVKAPSIPERVLPMAGFVVSKKISKSACRRNKMKRRLREVYRNFRNAEKGNEPGKQPLQKWYAVVFVIKENAFTASWSEICSSIEKAFLEAARRYG